MWELYDLLPCEYSKNGIDWFDEPPLFACYMRPKRINECCQFMSEESLIEFSEFMIKILYSIESQTGQTHLELDETQLHSTGTSVDIDDVLAKIDKALETDKE